MGTQTSEQKLGGKYREIVFAVALFLIFDLGVLILNFYTSYQIADDAVAINMAGRQRMLSQRITKALLGVQADVQAGKDVSKGLGELRDSGRLFDDTLHAFENGGRVKGGGDDFVVLKKIQTPEGQSIIADASKIWKPLQTAIPNLSAAPDDMEKLGETVTYARANNVALLKSMNALTTHLESLAREKADKLRLIQTVGIGLALLNFALVLFHFIRKLKAGDREVEAAQKENREILDTVGEGLFLLGPDMKLGTQFSAALSQIFGRNLQPGMDFIALLDTMVSKEISDNTHDFLDLLFAGRVKENLMGDLNPLSQVQVMVPSQSGVFRHKYLAMQFNRVYIDGKISHLLVTVRDATEKVELEQQLATTQQRMQSELKILLSVLSVNPLDLSLFTGNVSQACSDINGWLKNAKSGGAEYVQIVDKIFRRIHAIKGEAAALELETFVNLAHDFEDCLTSMRIKPKLVGEDFLPVALHLSTLEEQLTVLDTVTTKLTGHAMQNDHAPSSEADIWAQKLSRLAHKVAEDMGKTIQINCYADGWEAIPNSIQSEISDVAIQLVRNAIAHGIEPEQTRLDIAKPKTGHVQVALEKLEERKYRLLVRDDGQGLVPERIRAALKKNSRYTPEQIDAMSDNQVVMTLFEPGASTLESADKHAGRGVGLDLVQSAIKKLGAQLNIKTRADQFTAFTISFSVAGA